MSTAHTHNYQKGQGNVDVCLCGRFRFNEKAGAVVVEVAPTLTPYETRVRELEQEGCDTSDAQSIADVEFIQKSAVSLFEVCRGVARLACNQQLILKKDELECICWPCKAREALSKARGER